MSNSFKKIEKVDPFDSVALGDWKPDKKNTNKDVLAFIRTAEITIPEHHAQDWIDPITFNKMKIWGKTVLIERKLISKANSDISLQRKMEPAEKNSYSKKVI